MRWSVKALNDLLSQEHGFNPYGEPVFRWAFSEDLWWPACLTGRKVVQKVTGYLIGGGTATMDQPVPEYKKMRMSIRLRNQWVVTRWLSPEMLAGLKADFRVGPTHPEYPLAMVKDRWNSLFPGAELPMRGLHVHTDWANKPHMLPTYEDTVLLIAQLREQRSGKSFKAVLDEMNEAKDRETARIQQLTEDICEDSFTAFLNPEPGKRGGFVSYGGFLEEPKKELQNG